MRETEARILFQLIIVAIVFILMSTTSAVAADWQAEFDDLCAKTNEAEGMGAEEINSLIVRADNLLPVIESSVEPRKKVYIIRLKKCRSFFTYMLELKQSGR